MYNSNFWTLLRPESTLMGCTVTDSTTVHYTICGIVSLVHMYGLVLGSECSVCVHTTVPWYNSLSRNLP